MNKLTFAEALNLMLEGKICYRFSIALDGYKIYTKIEDNKVKQKTTINNKIDPNYKGEISYFPNTDINSDWYLYEPEKELKEIKFYQLFQKSSGFIYGNNLTKDKKEIRTYYLTEAEYIDKHDYVTNELAYTAYFDENDKVVKYVLPSGEVIEV